MLRTPSPSPLPLGLALALVAAAALTASPPAAGQELSVLGGGGSSGFQELARPVGVSVQYQAALSAAPRVRLVAGWRTRRDEGRRAGTTCDSYWPAEGCRDEPIAHRTRMTQWEVGPGLGLPLRDGLELRAAALLVRNAIHVASEGVDTGRGTGHSYPDGPLRSTAFTAGLAWTPWISGRLGLLAHLRHETLGSGACPTDISAPFCHARGLTTIEVGVLWGAQK